MKGLTEIKTLDLAEIESLLARASAFRHDLDARSSVTPSLDGMCVANIFFEPSTRTRLSFDLAAQRLGARVITFNPGTASTQKGESLRDSVLTISAVGADILVVRHGQVGAPGLVAEWTGLPVVNAGDGTNEHPTQMLIDSLTITRHFGQVQDLRVAIIGDVAHSRVAGSLIAGLPKLGAQVTLVGPIEWMPAKSDLPCTDDLDVVLEDVDVVYLLRVQTERGGVITDDYIDRFQIDRARASRLRSDAVVLHPGPMNRGVEIDETVADSARCLVIEQVRNGVPVRMAVLEALAQGAL